jgi:predicted ATPase/DNA-binding SARP family transcriptional activator
MSPALQVRLLGGFRVAVDGKDVAAANWSLRKARSLIKMLALAPGHRLHREQIIDALWPDLEPESASNNLRKVLHVARRGLATLSADSNGYLSLDDGVLTLAPSEQVWIDVDAFERAAVDARRTREIDAYRTACELYVGDLLPEDRYEDWAGERRAALRELYLTLVAEMADGLERSGHFAEAVEALERVVAMEPSREDGHVRLMRAYAGAGRRHHALRQFKVMREVLSRELGVEPEPASERLYREILLARPDASTGATAAAVATLPASRKTRPAEPLDTAADAGSTVTLLFTDIEGSTRMAQRLGDRYAEMLATHHALLRSAFNAHGGLEVDAAGDGFFVAFKRARDAVLAAVDAQHALGAHRWADGDSVRVRIGIHTGEPQRDAGGFVGVDVHRASRICAAAWGGQILVSQSTRDLVAGDLADLALVDLGQHRLKDLSHEVQVYQVTASGLIATFPPIRSLDTQHGNLPRQLTSFVGRQREIAEIKTLLQGNQLMTLSGPGGVGKTRLALRVAADLVDEFTDGAWLVDLAGLGDPALVPNALASAMHVQHDGTHILEVLVGHLRDRAALFVLDNCEHLVEACAATSEHVLRASPRVKILATSRESLGAEGEVVYRVASLQVPDPQQTALDVVRDAEAVRLFVERAVQSRPAFALTEQNASTVVSICQKLDGIPLAIELAAALVNALPLDRIASRLNDRFRLLTGGRRTALPRQQTLRAALDWSHDLLSEPERALLRRLSVFPASFSIDAAESVCAGGGLDPADVFELLARLIDKSLVLVAPGGGDARYRLLETIRHYSRERLVAAGEIDELRDRHLATFRDTVDRIAADIMGPDQVRSLDAIADETDNIRAALAWSESAPGRVEEGLRLLIAMRWYLFMREPLPEWLDWFKRLLPLADGVAPAVRMWALSSAGMLSWRLDEYPNADSWLRESRELARAAGDQAAEAMAVHFLAHVVETQGDYPGALVLFREEMEIIDRLGSTWWHAKALHCHGLALLRSGHKDEAAEMLDESLRLSRAAGDTWLLGHGLSGVARVAVDRGDYERAKSLLVESLDLGVAIRDTSRIATTKTLMGEIAVSEASYHRARGLFGESIRYFWKQHDRASATQMLEHFAEVAVHQEQPERAARLLGAAASFRELIGFPLRPIDRPILDRITTAARSQLGDIAFEAALARGRGMSLDQAVEYALAAS